MFSGQFYGKWMPEKGMWSCYLKLSHTWLQWKLPPTELSTETFGDRFSYNKEIEWMSKDQG